MPDETLAARPLQARGRRRWRRFLSVESGRDGVNPLIVTPQIEIRL